MDVFFVGFDLLRREAGSMMQTGGAILEVFVTVLRMQNAAPPRPEKSLILASVQASWVPRPWRITCVDS